MAIAVALGATSFDFSPLLREQQRLSKQLIEPVPRLSSDPTQTLIYRDGSVSYNCYIKVLEPNSSEAGALPTYQLYYRDNSNNEVELSSVSSGDSLGDATSATGAVTFDLESGTVSVGSTVAGSIQFQAVSGVTLAAVNRRLADINAAIEAMSRVMQVASGATEQVGTLLR